MLMNIFHQKVDILKRLVNETLTLPAGHRSMHN